MLQKKYPDQENIKKAIDFQRAQRETINVRTFLTKREVPSPGFENEIKKPDVVTLKKQTGRDDSVIQFPPH